MKNLLNVLKVLGVALLIAVVAGVSLALIAIAPALTGILLVSGLVLFVAYMIADGNGWLK